MNRENVINGYLINKPRIVAEMLYDTISKYESKICEKCKHYEIDRFENTTGTCRNKNVPTKNFIVEYNYGCNRHEKKDNK